MKNLDPEEQAFTRCFAIMYEVGFDTVQIVATKISDRATDHENTTIHVGGSGNFFARRGATQRWIDDYDQRAAAFAIHDHQEE